MNVHLSPFRLLYAGQRCCRDINARNGVELLLPARRGTARCGAVQRDAIRLDCVYGDVNVKSDTWRGVRKSALTESTVSQGRIGLPRFSFWGKLGSGSLTANFHKCIRTYLFTYLGAYIIITSPQSKLRRARRRCPIGYNGTPQIHPQSSSCPFRFDDHHPHLIHPSLDRPLSPPQTASGSNQPFCHSSLLRTDRWDKRIFCTISARLAMLIESDALIII